jgi:hypothetical protein
MLHSFSVGVGKATIVSCRIDRVGLAWMNAGATQKAIENRVEVSGKRPDRVIQRAYLLTSLEVLQ